MRNLLALLLFVPSLCHAQVPDYVAVEDLIAWYSFNGNADDSGPGSHNGILHNTSFTSDRHGELNGALEFNGSNSYVSVAHDVNLNLSGSEFTLSVWVNHHGFDEWDQNLVVKSDGPGSAPSKWLFWHKANVNAPSGLGFASNQMMLGGVEQVSTGSWHHYLVAKHSDRIEFYLDGQLESTEFVEFQNDPTTAELRIGGEEPGGGNQWFDGAMDDVGIWNRALSESEIQSLFSSVEVELPEHVPNEGLVAWYPLDGNALDLSGLGHDGIVNGPVPTIDRFGNSNGAYHFNDASSISANLQGVGNGNVPVTISSWVHIEQTSTDVSYIAGVGVEDAPYNLGTVFGMGEYGGSGLFATMAGSQFDAISGTAIPLNQWVMLTAVHEGDGSIKLYVDSTEIFSFLGSTPNIQFDVALIGTAPWGGSFWSGDIDEVGIWSRALTEEEVQAMFLGVPIEYGCTDSQACNYYEEANADNGLCEYGCLYCGDGTVWDSNLQECVTDLTFPTAPCGEGTAWDSTLAQCISIADTIYIEPIACAPSCGEGTVWDPVNEECIIAIPADLNYDGCVSVNDLLILLAVHGTCPPYPEWPDTDTTWACGDPLTYWDYDYATVLIGDQCWFAENLRSAHYADGTPIPLVEENEAWTQLLTGARCSYMNSETNFSNYGGLYNWYAVSHESSLCPTGWRVPDVVDMSDLATQLGGYPLAGLEMKSDTCCGSGWEGTNLSGFNALPGGWRNDNGTFGWLEIYAEFWESSATIDNSGNPDRYFLYKTYDALFNDGLPAKHGCSVRCIKD